MRRLADEVAGHRARQLARAQDQHLAPRRVSTDVADLHAGQDLGVAVEELDQVVAVRERREVIGDVACPAAHVRLQREVPLAALDEMTRLLESELDLAILIAPGQAAGVVPMQVGGDDGVDFLGLDAEALQRMKHALRLPKRDLLRALLAQLVADAGLADDDATVLAGDEAYACAVDHVVPVRRLLLLPQHPRHHTEHQAAVRLPMVGHQEMKLEVAQLHCALYAARNGGRGDQDLETDQGLRAGAGPFRPRPADPRAGGLRLPRAKWLGQDDDHPSPHGHDPRHRRVGSHLRPRFHA